MEPREGDVVTDNVRLVRLLGRGGMGSVWVARHRSLDVEVAVKFVSKELLSGGDPLVVQRFRREAKLAAKVESNHVVRIFDHGFTHDGAPYIVMELMRGESLADRLARSKRLPAGDAARIVSEVASGLSAAHAIGVVHRDIKPHNVFLARSRDGVEVSKILDFGIAKTTNASEEVQHAVKTSTGVLIGTPQYMSPEQLMRAGAPDQSADLWALSVVAYEIVTGKLPFAGETLAATLIAITRAEIQPPSSSIPEAPAELDAFFSRALAVDPARRFASAAELAAAFAASAGGISPATVIPSDAVTRPVLSLASSELATSDFLAARSIEPLEHTPPPSGPGVEFAATRVDDGAPASTSAPNERPLALSPGDVVRTKPSVSDQPPRASRTPGRGRSRSVPWIVAGTAAVIAAGAFAAGQHFSASPELEPADSATASATPPPAPAPSHGPAPTVIASQTKANVPPAAFKRQAVSDGRVGASGVWVPDFWVQREENEVGLSFLAAETACRRRGLALCSDPQLERACATYPELATRSTWTLSSESGGLVIRGGAAGCSSRNVVMADDVDPERTTACCTRAVALSGEIAKFGSPRNAANQVQLYETRFNAGQGELIAKDTLGSVGFFGPTLPRDKLADSIRWLSKTTRVVQERCNLTLVPQDAEKAWMAACTGLELELEPESPASKGQARSAVGVRQVFQRLEFQSSGLLRDIRTWQHPRRIVGEAPAPP